MRIVNRAARTEFRQARECGFCGRRLRHRPHVHHLHARGQGGGRTLDVRFNLIPLGGELDCACHQSHHDGNHPTARELLVKVARRERTRPARIELAVWTLRRLPKGTTYAAIPKWIRELMERKPPVTPPPVNRPTRTVLVIDEDLYVVELLDPGYTLGAVRLSKMGGEEPYTVHLQSDGYRCTCQDYLWRKKEHNGQTCKHIFAVVQERLIQPPRSKHARA